MDPTDAWDFNPSDDPITSFENTQKKGYHTTPNLSNHSDNWTITADSDWGEDPDSGLSTQPDHYPRTETPGERVWSDIDCPTCGNPMVDGACPQCDWGAHNHSQPVDNYPLDPFRDDNAGIRAGGFYRTIPESRWSFDVKI